jgi:cytidine deaminase
LNTSDLRRLSVSLVDVAEGREEEFDRLATAFEAALIAKNFGRAEMIRDEGVPRRFYAVRHWSDAESAALCHADPDVQTITSKIYQIARVTNVVNGVRKTDALPLFIENRRARVEADRRTGFERRFKTINGTESATAHERRRKANRRLGPRRLRDRPAGEVDLVSAARRAREFADAAYSKFKVGAALECADGTIVTGCNIENATYGLTICAERVAMFKALSEGHRAFTRIAIVADTDAPTPPCGACRQILWEFGGNLEIRLANLTDDKGTHQLKDLLPLPFDARLL